MRRKKEDKGLLGHRVTRGSKTQAAKGAALRAGAHAEAPQLCLWLWVCGRGRTRSLEAHEGKRQRVGDGVEKVAPWCPRDGGAEECMPHCRRCFPPEQGS